MNCKYPICWTFTIHLCYVSKANSKHWYGCLLNVEYWARSMVVYPFVNIF